ncbi:putative RPM1 interacting protein 13 [Cocos nucifera]|nr:putative RPM1 interacting protein 13 [Cocos nucifera]
MVIEISSSSDEETNRNKREAEEGGRRRRRKRRRIYSDVEVKTGEEKRREEEDCCILPFDPFAADLNQKLSLPAAQHLLDDLAVIAERGQTRMFKNLPSAIDSDIFGCF